MIITYNTCIRDYNFHVPPSQLPFFLVNIPPPGMPLQWNCSHITGLFPNTAWSSNGQLMFVPHQLSQARAEQNSLPSHFSFMNFSWFLCIWLHSFRFFSSPHSLKYFSHPNMAWEHFNVVLDFHWNLPLQNECIPQNRQCLPVLHFEKHYIFFLLLVFHLHTLGILSREWNRDWKLAFAAKKWRSWAVNST